MGRILQCYGGLGIGFKAGELFGFLRTAGIAASSALAIAQRAQEFGQNDDITVLTITRVPIGEEILVALTPAFLPSIF